jgi:hypothetical protein
MRCRGCNVKLADWEMIESSDGICSLCLRESGTEYNIFVDHRYEHEDSREGVTPPKNSEY